MGRQRRSTWVGHHDDDAVGAVLDDLRDDVLEDVDVALDEVEAALSLLLPHAGRDHHDARVGRHRIIWPRETSFVTSELGLLFTILHEYRLISPFFSHKM